jgi:heme/copper-type cytochrome/quinol oxidase subunit 3
VFWGCLWDWHQHKNSRGGGFLKYVWVAAALQALLLGVCVVCVGHEEAHTTTTTAASKKQKQQQQHWTPFVLCLSLSFSHFALLKGKKEKEKEARVWVSGCFSLLSYFSNGTFKKR